jgi:hypothetical protein
VLALVRHLSACFAACRRGNLAGVSGVVLVDNSESKTTNGSSTLDVNVDDDDDKHRFYAAMMQVVFTCVLRLKAASSSSSGSDKKKKFSWTLHSLSKCRVDTMLQLALDAMHVPSDDAVLSSLKVLGALLAVEDNVFASAKAKQLFGSIKTRLQALRSATNAQVAGLASNLVTLCGF